MICYNYDPTNVKPYEFRDKLSIIKVTNTCLDEHELLSDRQHAFRKWQSCETQLTTVIIEWAKLLGKKGQVDTLINAFLCFRQQRVVVNGIKSAWAPVVSGVPQGTVLGPLLFSLYINGISADIESEIRLFADDCVCDRENKNEEDTLKLQRDIRIV